MAENPAAQAAATLQAVVDGKAPVPAVKTRSNAGETTVKARSAHGGKTAKRGAGGRFLRSADGPAAGDATVSDGPSHGDGNRKLLYIAGGAAVVLGLLWLVGRSKRRERDRETDRSTVSSGAATAGRDPLSGGV